MPAPPLESEPAIINSLVFNFNFNRNSILIF
jgi:hypothetical protein